MADEPTVPPIPPIEPPPPAPAAPPAPPAPPSVPQPPTPPSVPQPPAPPVPQPPAAIAQPAYAPAPGYTSAPGYAPAPGYSYSPVPTGPTKGLAVASMVVGIIAILFFGWGLIPGVAAVVLGHIAQKRQRHAVPFWLTGLITGYVAIAWGVVVTIIVVYGFILSVTDPTNWTY